MLAAKQLYVTEKDAVVFSEATVKTVAVYVAIAMISVFVLVRVAFRLGWRGGQRNTHQHKQEESGMDAPGKSDC